MGVANKLYIKRILKSVYEIYGVLNGKFIKRQYLGYSKEQAIKQFKQEVKEGVL